MHEARVLKHYGARGQVMVREQVGTMEIENTCRVREAVGKLRLQFIPSNMKIDEQVPAMIITLHFDD